MSMKVPVVAVDAMGVSYILQDHKGGILVHEETDAFAQAVGTLLGDPQLYEKKSRQAHRRAMSMSANKMTRKLIKIYESLISE